MFLKFQKHLVLLDEIIKAKPTDGLWDDGRTDEDQIGATYKELEWAMEQKDLKRSLLILQGEKRKFLKF